MFLEISQNSQENTCARVSFLIKLQAETCNFIKKELWHRCFLVNFVKFIRTPFVTEHLRCMSLLPPWFHAAYRDHKIFTLVTTIGFAFILMNSYKDLPVFRFFGDQVFICYSSTSSRDVLHIFCRSSMHGWEKLHLHLGKSISITSFQLAYKCGRTESLNWSYNEVKEVSGNFRRPWYIF